MKTIKQHLDSGISCLTDIQEALQLAMQIEFATIPPYLCAQWSIRRDPDRVESVLHRIVNQEMQHLALTGNLMNALGAYPRIANAHFVPRYPLHALPGGIIQHLPVDLRPLTKPQLEVFMQIEYPEFGPSALLSETNPETIGEFYDGLIEGVENVCPSVNAQAFSVAVPHFSPIEDLDDAINMLERIKEEGEGFQGSPDQPIGDVNRETLSHYYAFKELFVQRRLVYDGTDWSFSGSPVTLPEVYEFGELQPEHPQAIEFSGMLSKVLMDLESCWKDGTPTNIAGMFHLSILGQGLIRRGIQPEFVWRAPAGA